MMNIAIDGPAGAGKSTLSKMLAEALGFIYVDTGALYRAIGFYAMKCGADPKKPENVIPLLKSLKISLRNEKGIQQVYLDGENVTPFIRTPEVSMAASDVSSISEVRSYLLNLQKTIARENHVVMDGRDIGTVVLPDAQLKFFLCASPEDRAKRRYEELIQKGMNVDYQAVLNDVVMRDKQDSTRQIAPLKPAKDAIVVDTTGFELEKSFATLLSVCREKLHIGGTEKKGAVDRS